MMIMFGNDYGVHKIKFSYDDQKIMFGNDYAVHEIKFSSYDDQWIMFGNDYWL